MENAIRPTAIGKKNWLFIADADTGQRSAIIYTLNECCRRRGINLQACLRFLFAGFGSHPSVFQRAIRHAQIPGLIFDFLAALKERHDVFLELAVIPPRRCWRSQPAMGWTPRFRKSRQASPREWAEKRKLYLGLFLRVLFGEKS